MKRAEDMNHDEACAWLDKMLKSNTKIPQWRVEIGYCGEVAAMFGRLVNCAGEAADGKPSKMDLSPEGWPRWVATVAAVYARKDPFKVAWGNIPDTCAELNKALDTLARLDATADGDAKRAEARRMEVEWAKLHGAARVREAWLLDRARLQAEDEVRIAEWKVKLAATEEERDKAEKDLAEARDNRAMIADLGNLILNYKDGEAERRREFWRRLETLAKDDPAAHEIISFRRDHPRERGWQVAFARQKGVTKQAVNKQWKNVKRRYPHLAGFGQDDPDRDGAK